LPALSVSVSSSTAQTCYGDSTASFILSASGGNGGSYEYSKDNTNWQTGATFSSLAGGTYTGYVRNSNRVGTVASVLVGNLARTQVSASLSYSSFNGFNIDCNGGNNGTITVNSASGGTGTGYQTSIDNVTYYSLPKSFTGLTVGTKTIYTKDSNDCVVTTSPTLTQPTALSISISGTAPTCYNGSNGSVTASVTGGAGTYAYYLSTNGSAYAGPQASATFSNLVNGTYSILVVDGNSCTKFSSDSVLNRTAPNATITLTNVSCNGGSNGSIAVSSGTGGSGGPYSASTNNSTWFELNKTFNSLSAGAFTIYIKDSSNCVQSYAQTITQPTVQTATITSVVNETIPGNGSLQVTSTGGVFPKTYTLYKDTTAASYTDYDYANDTLIVNTLNVPGSSPSEGYASLGCGYYYLRVVDANGCVTYSSHSEIICASQFAYTVVSGTYPVSSVGTSTITVTNTSGATKYIWLYGNSTFATSGTLSGYGVLDPSGAATSLAISVNITGPNQTTYSGYWSLPSGANYTFNVNKTSPSSGGVFQLQYDDTTAGTNKRNIPQIIS
jgi:hypothetical protein